MRTIFLKFVVLIAFCGQVLSQTQSSKESLYSVALHASILEMEKSWGHIDDGDGGSRVRTNYHHMFVAADPEITEHLPSTFGDHVVEYLDNQAEIARYKETKKEYSILKIHSMQTDDKGLRINISVYWVGYAKGRLTFGLSDWSDVKFRYDCEKQDFAVSSVDLGGI